MVGKRFKDSEGKKDKSDFCHKEIFKVGHKHLNSYDGNRQKSNERAKEYDRRAKPRYMKVTSSGLVVAFRRAGSTSLKPAAKIRLGSRNVAISRLDVRLWPDSHTESHQ